MGARVSRLTADWVTSGTSADSEIKSSFKALRNRARQLCRDNDYARQALRSIQNNVIGHGIKHQSQVRMQRGGRLDQAINGQIHEAWEKWMHKSRCDVSGLMGFHDMERLLCRSLAESGEVFVRMIRQPFGGSKVPFALQVLEADYLIDDDIPQAAAGNTVLYPGTGSSQSITGVGFQPDFVWIKGRSGATDHGLYDAVRGVQKQIESNTITAETTETTGLTAFNTDGFTVGALAQLNTSSATYVAWNWKANGAGSTNTAGTITSTVSANTTAGCSMLWGLITLPSGPSTSTVAKAIALHG